MFVDYLAKSFSLKQIQSDIKIEESANLDSEDIL